MQVFKLNSATYQRVPVIIYEFAKLLTTFTLCTYTAPISLREVSITYWLRMAIESTSKSINIICVLPAIYLVNLY